MAKWEGKGLQNPDHGFKSRRRLKKRAKQARFLFNKIRTRVSRCAGLRFPAGSSANPVDASESERNKLALFFYEIGLRVSPFGSPYGMLRDAARPAARDLASLWEAQQIPLLLSIVQ